MIKIRFIGDPCCRSRKDSGFRVQGSGFGGRGEGRKGSGFRGRGEGRKGFRKRGFGEARGGGGINGRVFPYRRIRPAPGWFRELFLQGAFHAIEHANALLIAGAVFLVKRLGFIAFEVGHK
jgi:hypothetical protein